MTRYKPRITTRQTIFGRASVRQQGARAVSGIATAVVSAIALAVPSAAFVKPVQPTLPPSALIKVDIIGEDQREAVPQRHRQTAESIGLLWQRGSGHACSAFCVGDDVVATNAHCIVRVGSRKARNLQLFRFVLAPEQGVVTSNHISTLLFAATDQPKLSFYSGNWSSRPSLDAMVQDWAFAKLSKPICRGKALRFVGQAAGERTAQAANAYMRATTPTERRADRLFMIAYHGDRELEDRWYSGNCERQPARRPDLIFHTCDTFKGSSGAPVMRMRDGKPEVVAINVGTYAHERYRYTRYRTRSGRVRRKKQIISQSLVNVGVKPDRFIGGIERFKAEFLLSSLNEFRDVQSELRARRHYRGRIDGLFGPKTRQAIIDFEQSIGIAPLGMPTRRLLDELKGRQPRPTEPLTRNPRFSQHGRTGS